MPPAPLLVAVEELVDAVVVAVAEQTEELPGMRTAGDEHQLVHTPRRRGLRCVRHHRPVVDRQQCLFVILVSGWSRVPLPPARMTPFTAVIVLRRR